MIFEFLKSHPDLPETNELMIIIALRYFVIYRTNPLEYNLKTAIYSDCGIAVQENVINWHPRAWQNIVGRGMRIFMPKW